MTREEALKEFIGYQTYDIQPSVGATKIAIKALEQEPCKDCISRKSIKQKLQEQHDFFVNAHGGFNKLSQNDKSRVDEITNCIAMVVNEPSVNPQEPKTGHWISKGKGDGFKNWNCSKCGMLVRNSQRPWYKHCPDCGARMESEGSDE